MGLRSGLVAFGKRLVAQIFMRLDETLSPEEFETLFTSVVTEIDALNEEKRGTTVPAALETALIA